MSRITGFAGAVLVAGAATLTIAAPPAYAEDGAIVCTGSQTANYAPPLGLLPQQTTVHVTERLGEDGGGTCLGPFGGGLASAVFHQQASCALPSPAGTLPEPNVITYHWNGAQSTITFTITTVLRGLNQTVVTSVGTVTGGHAQGEPAVRVKTLVGLGIGDCLAGSVEASGGPMTLTVGQPLG